MVISWHRARKRTAASTAPRAWYLQDRETQITYMRIEYHYPEDGWVYVICNPATIKNVVSLVIWDDPLEARRHASVWWKLNRVKHITLWKE